MKFNRMLTFEEAKTIYTKYLKKEESVMDLANRLGISVDEFSGLSHLLNYFGYSVDIVLVNNEYIIKR